MTNAPGWLTQFFSPPNTLDWAGFAGGTMDERWRTVIAPWVEQLQANPEAPVLLPHMDASGAVTWYAAGLVRRRLNALAEDLSGFLGQTYGGYTGRPHEPQADEHGGLVLAQNLGSVVYGAGPYAGDRLEGVRRALARYCRVVSRRPLTRANSVKSIGALRSRFERALAAGNEPEAKRLYSEILNSGRLSRENRLFLSVRLTAGLGKWQELVEDEVLLRQARLLGIPPQVRADLIEALYCKHIGPIERADNVTAAIQAFAEPGLVQNARFFLTRHTSNRPPVAKALLLHALHSGAPYEELERLASLLPDTGPDAAFANALRAEVASRARSPAPTPSADRMVEADTAFDDGEVDHAIGIYASLPPTRKTVTRIIQCADAIGSLEAARIAIQAAYAWTDTTQPLSASIARMLERLSTSIPQAPDPGTEGEPAQTAPANWSAWAKWAAGGANPDDVVALARNESATWPTDAYRATKAARELADDISAAAYDHPASVQPALPLLFEAFAVTPDSPVAEWKPIYSAILTALILSESRTSDELELARILTAHLTSIGLNAREYEQLMSDLKEILTTEASLNTLDWALDLAEVLVLNRSALPDKRLQLIVEILEIARVRAHRLSRTHKHALKLLCTDIDLDPPPFVTVASEAVEEQAPASLLADRSVGIYTLAESAGQRAAQLLAEIEPSARITLNSDLVCTERLSSLARSADLFVFAWRSSKHAAYYCVKNHRPPHRPILMPLGKGSASILQILLRA